MVGCLPLSDRLLPPQGAAPGSHSSQWVADTQLGNLTPGITSSNLGKTLGVLNILTIDRNFGGLF